MSYDFSEVVPWSLIYGAQNKRHANEVDFLEKKLCLLSIKILETAIMSTDSHWHIFMIDHLKDIAEHIDIGDVIASTEKLVAHTPNDPILSNHIKTIVGARNEALCKVLRDLYGKN